jgi:hypothetical protein
MPRAPGGLCSRPTRCVPVWIPKLAGVVVLKKDLINQRGGRDLKKRRPAGHAGTAPDTDGRAAENRGLPAVAAGPERPQAARECQSVSALIANAIAALDRGDAAEARALLRDVAARVALSGG